MNPIATRLATVRVAPAQTIHNLAMFPLLDDADVQPAYVTLDQAASRDSRGQC